MKTIQEIAREVGFAIDVRWAAGNNDKFEAFAELVREDEREACAKLVDDIEARCIGKDVDDPPLSHVAAAIRTRSTT